MQADDRPRQTLACFADLLEYPTQLPVAGTQEGAAARAVLAQFAESAAALGLRRLQEVYTSTFDLQPTCCLYVGYHLFGDSYKRATMLAKLSEEYRRHGFAAGAELPDHLAVMLRFVAVTADQTLAHDLAQECLVPALGAMARAFVDSDNPYGHVLRALLAFLDPTGTGLRGPVPVADPAAGWQPVLAEQAAGDGPPCAAWR